MDADRFVRTVAGVAWVNPLQQTRVRFDINSDDRIAMFLAQCAHESAGFTHLVESLNYSPGALLATFPKHFTPAEAVEFAHDDIRIAERVYGGRMGNGAEGIGDGYAFRGRGLLQITGRAMYAQCGHALALDLEATPALLEQPTFAAQSAGWVWAEEKLCNALADAGDFTGITKRINGGLNGLADREAWLDRIRNA